MQSQTDIPSRTADRPRFGARAAVLALSMVVVASGCTGTPDEASPTPTATPATDSSSANVSAPVDDPTSSPSTSRSAAPVAEPAAEVRQLWEEAHQRRLAATYDTDAEVTFGDVADEATADTLIAFVEAGRPAVPAMLVDAQFGTEVSVDTATVDITGCVLTAIAPPDGEASAELTTSAWEGQARRLPEGWRLTGASLVPGECVPADLSSSAVSAYREWLSATNGWWDPPDPDDPRIDELMAEPAVGSMREVLAEHERMGIAVRDSHDPSAAVVTDLEGDVVTVSDCYPAAEGDAAAVDLGTGERREDLTPSPDEDQLDAVVVELRRETSEAWVVVGWSTLVDVECNPGETSHAVIP